MKYEKFRFTDHNVSITLTETKISRTPSGKSWSSRGTITCQESISPETYTNYVQSIPFFNNFGHQARCRASWGYTCAGYLPTRITSVSPDGLLKIVHEFSFSY